MVRRIFFFLGILSLGVLLGVFVVGPTYRNYEGTGSAKPEFNSGGDSAVIEERGRLAYNARLIASLAGRLNRETRQRFSLQQRLERLEGQVALLQEGVGVRAESATEPEPARAPETVAVLKSASSSVQEEAPDLSGKLLNAGIDPQQVDLITRLLEESELDRLNLRDTATREGWLGTPRFGKEFGELNNSAERIREALDNNAYDSYLFALGRPNRVVVQSVIDDSSAFQTGIQDGDVIYRYAGERVFNGRYLTRATTEGEEGELVLLEVLRDGQPIQFYIPRGPIGVRFDNVSMEP